MRANKSTTKSLSILTLITLFGKIIAFIFEAVIAATLGASIVTDAYFSAAEFFTLVDTAFLSSLTVIAVNRFSHHINQEGSEAAFASLSNILSWYLPIMVVISVSIFFAASPLSYVIAPGCIETARPILIRCIRVFCVVPVIACVTSVELAILRQKKHFGITGLKSLFISVVGIVSLVLFGNENVKNADVLSVAFVVSMLLYCASTSLSIRKYGRLRLCRPVFNNEIKITIRMLLPLMVSYGIDRVALMVDKIISSMLGEGFVSCLTYAHSLYTVVAAVFITNLTTILLTDFNEMISQSKYEAVGQKIKSVSSVMTAILIPITIVSIICSDDVVKIVYERGNFNSNSTVLVAGVLLAYSINFIPAMLHGLYNQVLYAKGDTKTPMWIAFICIAINFGVSFALIQVVGLPGVAIGTVASSVISVLICTFIIRKHLPGFRGCYTLRFVFDCAVSAIGSVLGTLLIKQIALPEIFTFVLATAVCFALFFGIMLLLRDRVMINMMKKILAILKRRSKKTTE